MPKSITVGLFLALLVFPHLYAQQSSVEAELQSYVARQSAVWFEAEIEKTGVLDPGPWREPIESAFLRISNASGKPGFSIEYAVLRDASFNAACFPGGQFVINEGTLETLDAVIENETGVKVANLDAQKLRALREALIAPIIAHELGHYYCRHVFQSMKMQWGAGEEQKGSFDVRLQRFTQDNELEADRTGYLLLQRAGYNPDLMIRLLEVMNDLRQAQLKEVPSDSLNVYLETHPSPHARLAAFQGANQQLHKWAADLERAFSDVQLGTNLQQALNTIEEGLQLVPENLYLEKERAVALHKQWLLTVPLKEQRLRAIIDSPSFRDEMVFSSRGTRGAGKVIPGDRRLYMKAREAYMATYDKTEDPGFCSNFALLLAYSPDAQEENAAVVLALAAVKAVGTFENACNLATVLYLAGQKDKATSIVGQIAQEFDKKYSALVSEGESDPVVSESIRAFRARMSLSQKLNQAYVSGDFTPLLNLALCLAYGGQKDQAKLVAAEYLSRYEATSEWAQYLAAIAGVEIPKPTEKSPTPVQGVQIGSTLPTVLERWGKASTVSQLKDGDEDWVYEALNAEVAIRNGVVYSIALNAPKSPKVQDRFGVGSAKPDIESIIGPPKRISGTYTIYEGPQDIAVLYANDLAQQMVLFP
jgi:Zn-dependent protease with chaperone function/peptidoglycan hydrolase-like protein with peptidoglycan-binding domain